MGRSKPEFCENHFSCSGGHLPKEANRGRDLPQTLDQIGNFVRAFRTKLRFGEMSRAPLRLLRFQLQGELLECDWIARHPDEWDENLPLSKRELTATQQTLEDSLAVRRWLFHTFPNIESATLRVFREVSSREPELIIRGVVTPEEPTLKVLSLAMRAKLYGFQFWLNNGTIQPLGT